MKLRIAFALLLLPILVADALVATPRAASEIVVSDAWIAPPIGNRDFTAGFMTIRNSGADTELVAVECAMVKKLELHTMEESGGMMRMKMVPSIPLPRGQSVKLHPGGLHLMFLGLREKIAARDRLTLTLTFSDGPAAVRKRRETSPGHGGYVL